MNNTTKRRSFYAYQEDDEAIAAIMKRYGFSTDSDAIRYAVRMMAEPDSVKTTINKKTAERHRKNMKG